MKKKPPLNIVRTLKFWVRYDPKAREVVDQKTFKHQLAVPSKASGHVLVEVKGMYVPTGGDHGKA